MGNAKACAGQRGTATRLVHQWKSNNNKGPWASPVLGMAMKKVGSIPWFCSRSFAASRLKSGAEPWWWIARLEAISAVGDCVSSSASGAPPARVSVICPPKTGQSSIVGLPCIARFSISKASLGSSSLLYNLIRTADRHFSSSHAHPSLIPPTLPSGEFARHVW